MIGYSAFEPEPLSLNRSRCKPHADEIADGQSQLGGFKRHVANPKHDEYPTFRNAVLEPLEELESRGILFDKVLFLNDVVFTVLQR